MVILDDAVASGSRMGRGIILEEGTHFHLGKRCHFRSTSQLHESPHLSASAV